MINLKDYSNKKIAVLGLGTENEALILWLARQSLPLDLSIYDRREATLLGDKSEKINHLASNLSIKWQLGRKSYRSLNDYDELWRSPGWPIFCPQVQEAIRHGSYLNSPMNLFFEFCPTKNIIGVTGSKGKGTTASLIYDILKLAGWPVFLGGNIGVPPFAFFDQLNKDSWVVLELSSFQLEDLRFSPHIAVITNLYKEHLAPADPVNPNYHKSFDDYWLAKEHIFLHQTSSDWLVINKKLSNLLDKKLCPGKIKWFGRLTWPSKLIGEHNQENVAAAWAATKIVNVPLKIAKEAVANFKGLEHRLEFVGEKNGVRYYDDSFATNPDSTIIAIKSFREPIILLAGGADKGNDFTSLAKVIISQQVKVVILFEGEASPRFKDSLLSAGYPPQQILSASSMTEAMNLAKKYAQAGDIVLLSPACASFGLFKNYKERGNLFKQAV
ncbi:MAG TPA: UDP-N-acetylmuramoyl-L-alanine--D-glutamate ligase [Patescibacteria group bacterium]|nr:UDP-N-acetylmuramoyl-L-alanine--D-glutamate ligase [bacterium]HRT11126.1 UDP-N-acetylmuramoyl-L-alanine--D-glutamate ligase [Patescibacteria group bacterium]HRU89965.1 UDP-N-acetylmuramoyl-L-alanine--D-glutamate ligase [Patescibacteria group bacterium]